MATKPSSGQSAAQPSVGMARGVRPGDGRETSDRELVRLRALNAELRRLLEKHQWSGLTPTKSYGACPECGGSRAPFAAGHRPGCAIAAVLGASSE
ncbi:MAG TPA: hypothetical protein VEF89_29890 [Solirubrobacteraceae bacterium]|nr:hypothetical protein [Solirubrobacteraceae bacterium]